MTSPVTPVPPPRVDAIAGHIYTLPVVKEVPIPSSPGCWDATW